jgi:hypothetical protein
MAKTEVYSWRVSPETKTALEDAARRERATLGALLDRITREWLAGRTAGSPDDVEQRRLHAAAAEVLGSIRGGNPHRAEQARQTIRGRLGRRRAR